MRIKARVHKLEQINPNDIKAPVVFTYPVRVRPDNPDKVAPDAAFFLGGDVGWIPREVNESADDFQRRIYAIKATNKRVEDMTDRERVVAFAKADAMLEAELRKSPLPGITLQGSEVDL